VTDRITIEAVQRVNWLENQNSVMFTSKTTTPFKSSKKKGKKPAGPNPKAVAPTININQSSSGTKSNGTSEKFGKKASNLDS
jgi:hypothetical protein